MKKLSKVISFIFTLVLVMSILPTNVFAANETEDNETIISDNYLIDKKAKLIGEDGTEYLVNLYSKTDKIEDKDKINGKSDETETYVQEIAFKIDYDHMKKVDKKKLALTSDKNVVSLGVLNRNTFSPGEIIQLDYQEIGNVWDSAGDAEGSVKIYFQKSGDKYLVTRVTGSWLIHQSGTYIKDKYVQVVCNQGFDSSQYISKSISTASFDVTTGFTKYADSTQGIVGIGAKSTCTLYRLSGSSWKFEVPNMIAGSVPSL